MIKLTNNSTIETIESDGVRRGNNSKLVTLVDDDGTIYHVSPFVVGDLEKYQDDKGLPIHFNKHGYNECPSCTFNVETDDYYCRNCGQKIY